MSRWDDSASRKRERSGERREPPRKKKRDMPVTEEWGKQDEEVKEEETDEPPVEPEKPNFGLSGLLADESNRDETTGTVMKYREPKNGRKPKKRWRLHVFKNEEAVQVIPLHQSSYHLFGRDRKVAHIATDHPSCSSQHAVIQFRNVPLLDETGCETGKLITKPYIIDLESTNGTLLNDKKIKPSRYVELVLGDCIKFGFSTREYVLLFEEAV